MKYIKFVLIALMITCVTSSMNVFAGAKYYSFNVPGYNGSVQTELRTDKYLMKEETLENVIVSPTGDTLDVCMKNSANAKIGPWRIIEHGKITMFDDSQEILPANYSLYIDSRWNYTKSTYTSFNWYY